MTQLRVLLIAVMIGAFGASPAVAQIAAAIGKPLPSPDLPVGEVSVRVIAGSPANPVIGTDVTLVVNGTPRVARSDSAGRAIFKDLPAGATVQAKVTDEEKKEVASESFPLPGDSGVRVMISTRPFQPGAGGGAPFAGGAEGASGAMPEPRQMSGEPRPEQADAPGTFTVRVTYDDFKDPQPPENVPVTLVGYRGDDRVTVEVKQTDKEGRVKFAGLDRTGATSYFALALVPRNGATDRLMSKPAVLDSQVGVRLVLSSEKRDSKAPPIDELALVEPQDGAPATGKVQITLSGVPETSSEVALVDAATSKVVAKVAPTLTAPDPTDVQAQAQFQPKPDVPAGSIDVQVHGGAGGADEGLKGVAIKIMPVDAKGAPVGTPIESQTADNGTVRVALQQPAGTKLVGVFTINGKPLTSQPFDLAKSGGVMDVEAHWDARGKSVATYDVVATPGQVFYAEATMRGQTYRTAPFQTIAERGTHATLFVYPRVLVSFSLTSHIDDQLLAVQGRFSVRNNSWAPYVAGPDGMVLPLPKGFKGAVIAEQDQSDVSVAQGEGFRIMRPIPPGSRQFIGGFSMPVERGKMTWSLDLPYGAFQSGMEIMQVPGMEVQAPPNVQSRTVTDQRGTFFVLPEINILPKQSMVMTITGMPSVAAWRVWLPRIIGGAAILVMLGGLLFALIRKQPVGDTARAAKRQKLLDDLVELEKAGKADKRREAIVAELEKLWD